MSKEESRPDDIIDSFKVRRTCREMLADRGYTIIDDGSEANIDLVQFQKLYPDCTKWTLEGLRIIDEGEIEAGPDKGRKLYYEDYIKVINMKKLTSTEDIKNTLSIMKKVIEEKAVHQKSIRRCFLVIVVHQNAKDQAVNTGMEVDNCYCQVFTKSQLIINITKHVLVPKHILLSDRQKRAVLNKYRVEESKLPIIEANDPVARYLGMMKYDVVQIHRPSETTGIYISYRICKPEIG